MAKEAFYFVFDSYEAAAAALPSFESDKAKALRDEAARKRQAEQESFDRSDTDGCVTQWCLNIGAQECEREARLANNGGLVIEKALADAVTGEILTACITIQPNKFAPWQTEYVWIFTRNGKREYVRDYKRESKFAEKGVKVVYVMAPGTMLARSPNNFTEEKRGLGGLASYSGKHAYPDYTAAGLPLGR